MWPVQALFWLLWVALAVTSGFVAATMAARKHRSPVAFFVLGSLTSIIAVIVARFVPSRAPQGSRPVTCPRCNAVTNVADDRSEFECWQCKQQSPVPQPPPSQLALDPTRFKYAKTALTVLLLATVAVFLTIQFRESARQMDDAQDTILMICFREENGSYALGSNSREAIAECEKEHDAFEGGPRWRAMKANLDDWEKCITEARAQMATGNSSKFDECDEISDR